MREREKPGVVRANLRAQQKMHCALQRNHNIISKVADEENGSILKKSVVGESSEDHSVSSIHWKEPDHDSCAVLTILTIEPDGRWQILALPVHCPSHANLLGSREDVNMDGLLVVSSSSIASFKVEPATAHGDAASSGTNGNNATTTKDKKTNKSSGNHSHSSLACSDFSDFLPNDSSFYSSVDSSKVQKNVKRNSRQKAKKKGKHNKKLSPSRVTAGHKVLSEECVNGSSSSEICVDNDAELGSGISSLDTSPTLSPPESGVDINESAVPSVDQGSSDDTFSEAMSRTRDSVVLNSVHVDWISDDDTGFDHAAEDTYDTKPLVIPSPSIQTNNILGKRGKQVNKAPKKANAYKHNSNGGNSHAWKENNHSVWQKVQKIDAHKCNLGERKIDYMCSDSNIILNELPSINNIVESDIMSNSEDTGFIKVKGSRKLKKRSNIESKQVVNSDPRKGSYAKKDSSHVHTKNHVQHMRKIEIPSTVNDKTKPGYTSKPQSQGDSESAHILQANEGNLKPSEKVQNATSITNAQSQSNQHTLSSKCSGASSQSSPLKAHSHVYLPHLIIHGDSEAEKEVSHDDNKEGIYIGMEDSSTSCMHKSEKSSLTPSEEANAVVLVPRSTLEEKPALRFVTSGNAGITCTNSLPNNEFCVPPEDDAQISKARNQNTCSRIEQNYVADSLNHSMNQANCSTSGSYYYSDKIAQAVNDVCRSQLLSEAVQTSTGSPIAEFERFIHSATPVIRHSHTSSLGRLWEWYEKHGSYGLEVMANDYKDTNRYGSNTSTFHAYFVPFLSAVQLFPNQKGNPNVSSSGMSSPELLETRLLEPGFLPLKEDVVLEPLFEYFELEPPQRRQPLFEKIKELISQGSLPWKMYGDPTILASMDMHELHPKSWYAVAWYPIYRIPDDDFRAAFLTYHSIGHLVHKNAAPDSVGDGDCLVSPVVGLQSYNAQSECWFRPRHPEAVKIGSLNPSEIMNERIRTLQRTACAMATTSVSKANQTSVTRHPDFEFFITRGH